MGVTSTTLEDVSTDKCDKEGGIGEAVVAVSVEVGASLEVGTTAVDERPGCKSDAITRQYYLKASCMSL